MLAIYQLKIKVAKIFCEIFHVVAYFLVGYTCVDLSGLDIRMPKHLADRLNGNTLSERHRRGEGMAREVKGYVLIDTSDVRYLFQVTVHLLIGDDGQKLSVKELPLVLL